MIPLCKYTFGHRKGYSQSGRVLGGVLQNFVTNLRFWGKNEGVTECTSLLGLYLYRRYI